MQNFLKMALFTVAISSVYTGIAHLLPQVEAHPPRVVEIGPYSTATPEDLSFVGEEVFENICAFCHNDGPGKRCPDLDDIGNLAHERAAVRASQTGEPYTDVDYLVEALCQPAASLSEGYDDIMPNQGMQLSGGQILAVVAWLQEQGSVASVRGTDVAPLERFGCLVDESERTGALEPVGPPEQAFFEFACHTCHAVEDDSEGLGPSLRTVGDRLNEGALYESLLDPDATVTEPYLPGVMKALLDNNGFYERMGAADYRDMVQWLAGLTEAEDEGVVPAEGSEGEQAAPAEPGRGE